MIPQEVYNYDYKELVNWLRNEAGSSNPEYFKAVKSGGLKLQQVPEEYASLLLLLKEHKPKSYLELGIGNGGSFAMACFFMKESLERAIAVDNLAYGNLIGQNEQEVRDYINSVDTKASKTFHNKSTDFYFEEQHSLYNDVLMAKEREEWNDDVIFIDADHSYEGVRKDFMNAQRFINEGGLIIFHDIASKACPGIMKIWSDIKKQTPDRCIEFIESNTCGIGVVKY